MEQSIQTAAFIYGLISLVTLIVFFVMANNVSKIKKSLTREEPDGYTALKMGWSSPDSVVLQSASQKTQALNQTSIIIAIIVFVGLISIPAGNKRDEMHQADAALQNQVSTVQVKMCTKCNIEIPLTRAKLGYVDCIDCCSKIVATTRH
jgi:hypothetical protein